MERLTERKDGRVVVARSAAGAAPVEAAFQIPAILDRLAAYEDSGLPPALVAVAAYPGREVWVADSPDGRIFRVKHGKVCSVTFTRGACLRASAGVLFDGGDYVDTMDPDVLCFTEEAARAACEKLRVRTEKVLASWEAAMEAEQ